LGFFNRLGGCATNNYPFPLRGINHLYLIILGIFDEQTFKKLLRILFRGIYSIDVPMKPRLAKSNKVVVSGRVAAQPPI